MFSSYQERKELEDDLYQGDGEESEGSEATSELEFRLYSQLHYSSNVSELKEQDGEQQPSQEPLVPEEISDSAPSSEAVKQRRKNKTKTGVKQKKGKLVPQSPSPLSPFEEVIVIDSNPEVITISDDDTSSDNKGVCALKGSSKPRVQTSTPVQQASHKKVTRSIPVTVDSDSSHSSDSSDSLENWMILGGDKEDGDNFISLNLRGLYDISSDTEVDHNGSWLVTDKDREAQICNKDRVRRAAPRFTNRYYTEKNVLCRNCKKVGHLSKNCSHSKETPCYLCADSSHLANNCPNKHCNNCGLPGHLHKSCNERHFYYMQCHRCNMWGHSFDACPEIWRQYHITTKQGPPVKKKGKDHDQRPAYCYNCSSKKHFGHDCTRQRMFYGTLVNTQLINHYDTKMDIKRRESRLKWKVKGPKKCSFIQNSSQTTLTPGPPKKKQKISHENNSKVFSRQFANHKPSPGHAGSDFKAGSNLNKHKQENVSKQWKPKRAVPKKRPAPSMFIVDESEDLPRGGGEEKEKKKKKKKKKKLNQVLSNGSVFGTESICGSKKISCGDSVIKKKSKETNKTSPGKSKKKKDEKKTKKKPSHKKISAQMYPTDENLFIIKQRKRKR
uniref:zinc finger CCHC domain-containing protein 7 n=1 Tax=Doryrhamphus excisus TaxID=161450 RepID=UPI0025ADB5F6|nr:zinc finger CCHC domain-containing protein 7 [Doryrhamphus excisus]